MQALHKIAIIDFAFDSFTLSRHSLQIHAVIFITKKSPSFHSYTRLPHMLFRPYGIVILSDFDFIFVGFVFGMNIFFCVRIRLSVTLDSMRFNEVGERKKTNDDQYLLSMSIKCINGPRNNRMDDDGIYNVAICMPFCNFFCSRFVTGTNYEYFFLGRSYCCTFIQNGL